MLLVDTPAAAEPRPTLAEVQRQVEVLHHQAEQATERYNTARVELTEANRRLRSLRNRAEVQAREVDRLRTLVGRIASASYRAGTVDPAVALVLSDDPESFLRQAVDLTQLSRRQAAQLRGMATAERRLAQDRKAVRQERARAAGLRERLAAQRATVERRLAAAQRLLGSLRAEQRQWLAEQRRAAEQGALAARDDLQQRASRSSRDGTVPTYDGPACGRAAAAVRTAFAQIGDPYVWAAAPGRTRSTARACRCSPGLPPGGAAAPSSAQCAATGRAAIGDLQPGDLVFYYSPISHVAMDVGAGRIVDVPAPRRSI